MHLLYYNFFFASLVIFGFYGEKHDTHVTLLSLGCQSSVSNACLVWNSQPRGREASPHLRPIWISSETFRWETQSGQHPGAVGSSEPSMTCSKQAPVVPPCGDSLFPNGFERWRTRDSTKSDHPGDGSPLWFELQTFDRRDHRDATFSKS